MNKMYVLCGLLILAALTACSGRSDAEPDYFELPVQARPPADHRVLVFLGPGYSGNEVVVDALDSLFGLDESEGLITLLPYPESLQVSGRVRWSRLVEYLDSNEVTALVLVGAEELAGRILAGRDQATEKTIISIIPEGEPLAAQAASFLVVSPAAPADLLTDESAYQLSEAELVFLTVSAVLAAEERQEGDIPSDRWLLASRRSVKLLKLNESPFSAEHAAWRDPETGLRARNHLVLDRRRNEL